MQHALSETLVGYCSEWDSTPTIKNVETQRIRRKYYTVYSFSNLMIQVCSTDYNTTIIPMTLQQNSMQIEKVEPQDKRSQHLGWNFTTIFHWLQQNPAYPKCHWSKLSMWFSKCFIKTTCKYRSIHLIMEYFQCDNIKAHFSAFVHHTLMKKRMKPRNENTEHPPWSSIIVDWLQIVQHVVHPIYPLSRNIDRYVRHTVDVIVHDGYLVSTVHICPHHSWMLFLVGIK